MHFEIVCNNILPFKILFLGGGSGFAKWEDIVQANVSENFSLSLSSSSSSSSQILVSSLSLIFFHFRGLCTVWVQLYSFAVKCSINKKKRDKDFSLLSVIERNKNRIIIVITPLVKIKRMFNQYLVHAWEARTNHTILNYLLKNFKTFVL